MFEFRDEEMERNLKKFTFRKFRFTYLQTDRFADKLSFKRWGKRPTFMYIVTVPDISKA